jgi:putative hydrolase of the HAD superfamily
VQLSGIRHIFFDLDHTLWDYDRNSGETLSELYELFSLKERGLYPKVKFIESFHKANLKVWDIFDENRMNRDLLREKRMELVFEDFGIESQEIPGFHEAYYLGCSQRGHLVEGSLEILEFLKPHFSLHIITNGFEDSQHAKLHHSGIAPYFRTVTTSELADSKKPDPEYFSFALNLAGAQKENSLVIGDGIRTDVAGSVSAGIPVLWFNPEKRDCPYPGVRSISSLLEIKDHFIKG